MPIQIEPELHSVVMENVSWDYYSRTLEELGPSRGFRIIFDQGRMEIVTTSNLHERIKKTIARLLEMYAAEAAISIVADGTLTLRRESLKKGLEPDECYYVQTPAPPATEGEFDLSIHPPPDLAIEVEISRGSISKMEIYGALKVREIWRYKVGRVVPMHLTSSGEYVAAKNSLAFPNLDMGQFNKYVKQAVEEDVNEAIKALRKWVRSGAKGRAK
jgi:Uma2 family endonuclease